MRFIIDIFYIFNTGTKAHKKAPCPLNFGIKSAIIIMLGVANQRGKVMDKFLKKYYKQLHFNSMPAPVRAKFMEWLGNDTLTDDMKNWVRDYMHDTPNGKVQNDLPDTATNSNDLSDNDAKTLFIAFQNAFAGMDAAKNTFKDKDPQSAAFVNEYFGAGKLFKVSPAKPDCETGIAEIINLIKTNSQVKRIVLAGERDGKKLFDDEGKLDEFIKKCEQKKFNSDASVQKKVQQVASVLENAAWSYSGTAVGQAIEDIHESLNKVMAPDAFAMDPASIDPNDLQRFRDVYVKNPNGLLQTLYFNKTIRNRFANYDNGQITGPIEKAEKEVNYQDPNSENYVGQKMSDELTPLQQLEKWASDTYADTLKKYEELRGGTLFFSKTSKNIFAAIDKVKVKPVDGLDGLLKKKSDIEGKLGDPVSRQHFKWFTETMEPIAKSMPKAVAGAWKNSSQMKAVITQIILKATNPANDDPHAMEKAKTAMEIMTAMKYGMMTSKVMDAMKQTDFTVFSDGKLSWNKNEGIKFVTSAFDKSVKAAFLGVGYGITIVKNKIMMSGMEFNNKNNQNGTLASYFNAERQRLTNKEALDRQLTADKNNAAQADITRYNNDLRNLDRRHNINDATIARKEQQVANQKTRLDTYKQNMETYQQRMQRYQNAHNEYTQKKAIVDEYNNLRTDIANLTNEQTNKRNGIIAKRGEILNPNTYIDPLTGLAMGNEEKKEKETQLTNELKQLQTEYKDITDTLNDKVTKQNNPNYYPNTVQPAQARMNALAHQNSIYENAENDYNNTQTRANALQQRYDALSSKTQQFRHANEEITELTTAINNRNTALANWPQNNVNKIVELENYWNWLQSGDNKTWGLSLKRAQKSFDKNKQQMLQNYISQYGLTA